MKQPRLSKRARKPLCYRDWFFVQPGLNEKLCGLTLPFIISSATIQPWLNAKYSPLDGHLKTNGRQNAIGSKGLFNIVRHYSPPSLPLPLEKILHEGGTLLLEHSAAHFCTWV